MTPKYFLVDEQSSTALTYDELYARLSAPTCPKPHILQNSCCSQFFLSLLQNALCDQDTILIDSNSSATETNKLLGNLPKEKNQPNVHDHDRRIRTRAEFIQEINKSSAQIGIFTSGTTGVPKLIYHPVSHFINHARINDKHNKDVWGLAYNPSHIAGLNVFFQALLNENTMINLFGLKIAQIDQLIQKYAITHISATPSFFNNLTSSPIPHPSIKRVTFGGERFNPQAMDRVRTKFPSATFLNIYASTEAGTLFTAQDDCFQPRAEIIDKIKIKNNRLHLHKSILGVFDIPEEWYDTGDIVDVINETPLSFKFVSRAGDVINVGGYNINPLEVEAEILTYPTVSQCKVYGKKNSVLGNILACELVVTAETTEKELRSYLQNRLQNYKIPRIWLFVENIETTRSGKLKRR